MKYDVRYSQGYHRSYSWRYQTRVEANSEDEAKQKVIDKCLKERPDEKVLNIRVNKAQDYICWSYNSTKMKDGTFGFKKEYYGGYLEMPIFGYAVVWENEKEKAKKFMMDYELKDELKKLGRKVGDFKIEKIEA